MMKPMDLYDAFAESCHNKVNATLGNGTRLILERHWTPVEYHWTLYVAFRSDEHYGTVSSTRWSAVRDDLLRYGVETTDPIWLPIEVAKREQEEEVA